MARLLPPAGLTVTVAAVMAVLLCAAIAQVDRRGPFTIPQVTVTDPAGGPTQRTDPAEVLTRLDITVGQPWWAVPWGDQQVGLPTVDAITVVPVVSGAAVLITETSPVAVVIDPPATSSWAVGPDGRVIGPPIPTDATLPRITHTAAEWATAGLAVHPDVTQLAGALAQLDDDFTSEVTGAYLTALGDIAVHRAGVEVVLGDSQSLQDKAAAAQTVLRHGIPAGATLDVRSPEAPTVRNTTLDELAGR